MVIVADRLDVVSIHPFSNFKYTSEL